MSETENLNTETEVEELPIEDQKKAINLQDLVYVKKYIADNHYSKEETSTMISSEVDAVVKGTCYTKTETDDTFYKRTDTVDNAAHAAQADNATQADNAAQADNATQADNAIKVNNVVITKDENGILKADDIIIPQEKILWSSESGVVKTSSDGLEYKEITDLEIAEGDIIELEYRFFGDGYIVSDSRQYFRFKYYDNPNLNEQTAFITVSMGYTTYAVGLDCKTTSIRIRTPYKTGEVNVSGGAITVYGVRKIIK